MDSQFTEMNWRSGDNIIVSPPLATLLSPFTSSHPPTLLRPSLMSSSFPISFSLPTVLVRLQIAVGAKGVRGSDNATRAIRSYLAARYRAL